MVQIKITSDGSHTLISDQFKDETYHSANGAVNESQHIFIENGLKLFLSKGFSTLNILEIGFGTGLNAFLSLIEVEKHPTTILKYHTVEAFPISIEIASQLNYPTLLNFSEKKFIKLHESVWNEQIMLGENFYLHKISDDFKSFQTFEKFDLVYYDAFSPAIQPALWEKPMLQKIYDLMNQNSVLTTYCAKGSFKRILKEIGFEIESLPGPIGKREITRATKK